MDCIELSSESPYELLLKASFLIPISHYFLGVLFLLCVFLYNFVEIHFFQDLFTAFRGQPVTLTFNSSCELYQEVVSKCKILHGRYLSTPWLCSPHIQTAFLQFFGRAPVCNYRRQIFHTSDGGTIALDWLTNADVKKPVVEHFDGVHSDDKGPIMVVIPGLTSDSDSAYIKHLAFKMAKSGWNVVVSNHRGLGGVSITSDCFYNAGWSEDARKVIDYLHTKYPQTPLFVVGTSIGANVLVKHLGEEGANTAIVGAAAICSPWDLLSRSIRDFDHHATRVLANLETVDTYYRKASCTSYIGNVMVPLLCISSLDDPVCTREAIPWDECRANKNIVLATTHHGGHLAYFEGITAKSSWWVRAIEEYFRALKSSSLIHRENMQNTTVDSPLESSIDQAPYVNVREDGMITAFSNAPSGVVGNQQNEQLAEDDNAGDSVRGVNATVQQEETNATTQLDPAPKADFDAMMVPVKRCLNQLSRHSKISMWVLAYAAIITTLPILGSALPLFFKKKLRNIFSISPPKR